MAAAATVAAMVEDTAEALVAAAMVAATVAAMAEAMVAAMVRAMVGAATAAMTPEAAMVGVTDMETDMIANQISAVGQGMAVTGTVIGMGAAATDMGETGTNARDISGHSRSSVRGIGVPSHVLAVSARGATE